MVTGWLVFPEHQSSALLLWLNGWLVLLVCLVLAGKEQVCLTMSLKEWFATVWT